MDFKNEKLICFAGGILTAVIGTKIVKNPKTREMCVKGIAKGMKLHRDAEAAFQSIKEDAQDICYDAKLESNIEEQ